jgi:branched-chain amino acid transport system substrate-binding protein
MLKKKLSLLLSFIVIIALFSGFSAKPVIKVGVVEPLSGGFSTFGASAKNALLMLQDEVNKSGGINGSQVKFVIYDDEGKPATAALVGSKLINQDKVVGIVGPLTSGCANALAPIAVAKKIPVVTGTATNPTVTANGKYIFRSCFIDPFQGTVLAKFAIGDLKAKKAAVLFDNGNDYSKGLSEFFQKGFKAAGGAVVDVETYSTNDQDFNAQLTKIQATKPDVILVPDYYNVVGIVAKEARALGITVPMMGGDGWDSADLVKIGGTAVNGCYYSNHYTPSSTSPLVVKFVKAYQARYKAVPDAMAALNYDAAQVLLDGIKRAGGKLDGDSIQQSLLKANITVVSGHITFDKNRDAVKSAVILKVENGKTIYVKTVNP